MKTTILAIILMATLLAACESVEDKCQKFGYMQSQQRHCIALHKAASKGEPVIQFALAMEYLEIGNIPNNPDFLSEAELERLQDNYDEGIYWLRKSADQGFADAQYELAREYSREIARNAKWVPREPVLAYYYAAISGMSGHEDGSRRAAALIPRMTSEQVEEAKSRVAKWQRNNK